MAAGTDLPRFDQLSLNADGSSEDDLHRAALQAVLAGRSVPEREDLLKAIGFLATPRPVVHGMPGYRKGCRCKSCRKANAARCRRQRAAKPRTYLTEEQWQARKNGATR